MGAKWRWRRRLGDWIAGVDASKKHVSEDFLKPDEKPALIGTPVLIEKSALEWNELSRAHPWYSWGEEGAAAEALAEAFGRLDALARGQVDQEALEKVGDRLSSQARERLDAPSREAGAQAWRRHLAWAQAAKRARPEDLEMAALAAGEAAWWEEAGLWSQGLVDLSVVGEPMEVGDEMALDWGQRLAQDFGSLVPLFEGWEEDLRRSLAVGRAGAGWRARAAWPWPERPVPAETKEWALRKWGRSLRGEDEEMLGAELAKLDPQAPWLDLARALIRIQRRSSKPAVESPCGKALMGELDAREQERRLRAAVGKSRAPATRAPRL